MFKLIACKGEILYATSVSAKELAFVRQDLIKSGYKIISCTKEKS